MADETQTLPPPVPQANGSGRPPLPASHREAALTAALLSVDRRLDEAHQSYILHEDYHALVKAVHEARRTCLEATGRLPRTAPPTEGELAYRIASLEARLQLVGQRARTAADRIRRLDGGSAVAGLFAEIADLAGG